MQLQFEKKEVACLTQVLRAVKDLELTQEIRLTEDLPDVSRVLAGWGQVILRGKEWQGSRMAVSGGIQATVLYAPEDGTDPQSVDVWIPFQMKWDGAETDREGPMRVQARIRFVDGRNLSARKILVRCGISCLAEGLTPRRTEIYAPGQVPEDVQLLRRCYPVRLDREAGEKAFSLEQLIEPGSMPVRRILACSFQPELSEARVSGDKVALRGVGNAHLVYYDPENRIRTRDIEMPFSQLGELENTYADDAQADVLLAVTGLETDMEADQISLKCGLVAQYMISGRSMVELTEDAYSLRRDVGIRQEELRLPMILDETRERISARGALSDLDMEAVDVEFRPGFPKLRREGDCTQLELPGRFQILGYDREGKIRCACLPWEGTASLRADPSGQIDALALPAGQPQWSATGNGIEARAEVQLVAVTRSGRGLPMITALELGAERDADRDRPALILCRPGERGLWEIAKTAGSRVDAIRAANALSGDPEDDRMLLIPIP